MTPLVRGGDISLVVWRDRSPTTPNNEALCVYHFSCFQPSLHTFHVLVFCRSGVSPEGIISPVKPWYIPVISVVPRLPCTPMITMFRIALVRSPLMRCHQFLAPPHAARENGLHPLTRLTCGRDGASLTAVARHRSLMTAQGHETP